MATVSAGKCCLNDAVFRRRERYSRSRRGRVRPEEGVSIMSQRVCLQTGVKSPDLATCGGLCAAFPACLPPLSDTVQAEFVRRLVGSAEEARALLAFLTMLQTALGEGLEGSGPGSEH